MSGGEGLSAEKGPLLTKGFLSLVEHDHPGGEACRACLRNAMREGVEGHAQGVAAAAETLATARRVSDMYFLRTKTLAAVLLDARGLVRGMDSALDERIDAALSDAGFRPTPPGATP